MHAFTKFRQCDKKSKHVHIKNMDMCAMGMWEIDEKQKLCCLRMPGYGHNKKTMEVRPD